MGKSKGPKPAEKSGLTMPTKIDIIPPEKFPDPWLYDTAALLADLDNVRELILRIPLSNASFAPTNAAVTAVWELRDRLRFLIGLQAAAQRDWKKTHDPATEPGLEVHLPAAETSKKQLGA